MPRGFHRVARAVALMILAVMALLCLYAQPARAVQRTGFDHLTTGYELLGAHRDLSCEYCHTQAVFKGTPRTCSGCHTTGSRVSATARPPTHITTRSDCALCHSQFTFQPVVRVDHSAVLGACFSCHNGAVAQGKTPNHIPSDNNCDACHTTVGFVPARTDHADLVGGQSACRGCHSGVRAASVSRSHVPTGADCGECHTTFSWSPARFNHSNVTGNCQGCHNGASATGKMVGHMTTMRDCATCHRYPNWTVVSYLHASAEYPGAHRGTPACQACHSTPTEQATRAFAAYRSSCAGCHANAFRPELHQKTAGGLSYTVAELQNCTGSCHVYTDATATTVAKGRPAGHHKVTDGAF
ncbi:MAG TPA: hypothetical protein VJQ47_02385 [Steroidobacteraceae bacterium]|nr:hypothetical protein [Steroidobacteraceae bacterium]